MDSLYLCSDYGNRMDLHGGREKPHMGNGGGNSCGAVFYPAGVFREKGQGEETSTGQYGRTHAASGYWNRIRTGAFKRGGHGTDGVGHVREGFISDRQGYGGESGGCRFKSQPLFGHGGCGTCGTEFFRRKLVHRRFGKHERNQHPEGTGRQVIQDFREYAVPCGKRGCSVCRDEPADDQIKENKGKEGYRSWGTVI